MLRIRNTFKILWIVIFIFSLSPCYLHAQKEEKLDPDIFYQDFEEFISIIKEIQDKYVDEVGLRALLMDAYKGMLAGLDPHSQFIDAKSLEELKIETEGEFDGLGIEVIVKDGFLTVLTPIVDSPAFRAGVYIGDIIIKIDGKTTKNISISEAIEMLRGKTHTEVTLTVVHEGESEPVDITIKRAKIHLNSTRGTRIVDEEGKIGYVAVTSFQDNTATDLDAAVKELENQGMESLILDLRFNPGGLLNIAVDMSDRFIKKGVIVSTKGRHKSQLREYNAHRSKTYKKFSLVILVNSGSASASEIVAGAVKDHKRGLLLGTKTFGKGSVQSLILIKNKKSALKLTTAKYYTPSGTMIDGVGIEPDIKVDLTKKEVRGLHRHLARVNAADIRTNGKAEPLETNGDDKEIFVDKQLARAIDVLKGISVDSKNN
ncbi:MAG: S41 family peptidase [Candidatus Scalindua sp.]|nr:S41 family peptidase [Candidatus Scalindua sp.]MBT5303723.1 S41 family peptidase [Candidatus Scalindua sp.]MBT6053477.1 S41 family peptidase [Candidatus Scalindua sp.]MBT6563028.1 S41 family peptidase [Candidatus Scalindua sp.]MBT7213249.1 S41 family peptidase [Candidatus Scalindua sp.]